MFGEPVEKERFEQIELPKTCFMAYKGKAGQLAPTMATLLHKTKGKRTAIHLHGFGDGYYNPTVYMDDKDYGVTWCVWDDFFR